ncbi:MAG: DUF5131 family protein [Thermoplasmata archaeon]
MGETTGIEWSGSTWNPWIGCHHVSPGCDHCYAETLVTNRMGKDFRRLWRTKTFDDPLHWERKGKTGFVFTCSLSDFFHADADKWREEAWSVIRRTPHLTYQILTKRPERISAHLPHDWGDGYPNVWLGTSGETCEHAHKRGRYLSSVRARIHFLSAEPVLGPFPDFYSTAESFYGWVIAGGESGPGCRPCDPEWLRQIRDGCREARIPFFFKQWGGPAGNKRDHEKAVLDGRLWKEMPA